jgi:hypothetical protein
MPRRGDTVDTTEINTDSTAVSTVVIFMVMSLWCTDKEIAALIVDAVAVSVVDVIVVVYCAGVIVHWLSHSGCLLTIDRFIGTRCVSHDCLLYIHILGKTSLVNTAK